MSDEVHHKTYEEMYYDSERLNMEAREKLFHQSQRITHLESVIKDMSEALGFYEDRENWDDDQFCPTIWNDDGIDMGNVARNNLLKHKYLLDQLTAQAEKGRE